MDARSDYTDELAKIDRRLETAEPAQRLFWLYTRASLTGAPDDWREVWRGVGGDVQQPRSGELLLYRATAALELHRPEEAEAALDRLDRMAPDLGEGSYAKLLRGDVALQRHETSDAERIYRSVLTVERSWRALARVAYLERLSGRFRRADRLYEEAQEPLSAKEMRRWAWLELQRGLVDLDRGRRDEARDHLLRADRAYSGYWLIESHLSELDPQVP
ncbi:MAG: hypothetical protein MPN21_22220 [Thermoanaerobaculia bacterium]|nr:hypothetical protein [Thermoanaerobaculia bacterium]